MFVEKLLKKNRIPREQFKYAAVTILLWVFIIISVSDYLKRELEYHTTVPKILHKTTKVLSSDDIQGSFYKECEAMYIKDGWEVKLWYDDDIDLFMLEHFPYFYDDFKEITPKIKQVDAVRYLFMYRFGGIYNDMDSECIRPATNFINGIEKGSTAWLAGYPEPFFLMSTPGNEFWIFAFKLILQDWKKYNVRSTGGPQGLNRMAKAYVATMGQDSIRPFVMHNQIECDLIEPKGDVVCGDPTFRWIEAKEQFVKSTHEIIHKIGFIPNKLVDPTTCLSRIGSCKKSHCHDRLVVQSSLFVHHCLFSWKSQANG